MKNGITVAAYGFKSKDGFFWETAGISIVSINGEFSFWLCQEEINIVEESLSDIEPLKNERWHYIQLERFEGQIFSMYEPQEIYYSCAAIELVPLPCDRCGSEISEDEADKVISFGVNPYCSQYCAEVANCVPIPGAKSELVFDKIWNDNKTVAAANWHGGDINDD